MKLVTKILLLFVGLILLLSTVRTLSGVKLIEDTALKLLDSRLSSDLNLLTFAIDRELYHAEKYLSLVMGKRDFIQGIRGSNKNLLSNLFKNMLHGEDLQVVQLTDKHGNNILKAQSTVSHYEIISQLGPSRHSSKGFALVKSNLRQFPSLYVSMPVNVDGQFYGALSGFILLDKKNYFLANVKEILSKKSDEPVHISIFHNQERLYSTLVADVDLGKNDIRPDIARVLYAEGKSYSGDTIIDGERFIARYIPVQDASGKYSWSYGIAVREAVLTNFKKKVFFSFVGLSVLATAAVIVIGMLVTRGIKPSLGSIIDSCQKIEEGNLNAEIRTDKIKINVFRMIASALQKMANSVAERKTIITKNMDSIQKINQELEEKSKQLRLERQKFLVILETIDDGLVTINSAGVITYFNNAAERIIMLDRHAVIGRHYQQIIPGLNIYNSNQGTVQEAEVDNPSSSLYLKVYISPYFSESNEGGHVLLFRDVSKEKKLDEFKADFISSITHDIKSLLVPIDGFLKRILKEKYGHIEPPLKERLATIQENAAKIYQLVENYLNISKIESGRLELNMVATDIADTIREVAQLYGPRIKAELTGELPPVLADRAYVERVFINLIVNAIKFSPENSTITINAVSAGEMVVLSVKDEGIGIPPEEIQFIFEKYRSGSFGKKGAGSGLGLFIVRSIVKAHGGDIWVQSAVGKGSTFFFSLPVFKGEA